MQIVPTLGFKVYKYTFIGPFGAAGMGLAASCPPLQKRLRSLFGFESLKLLRGFWCFETWVPARVAQWHDSTFLELRVSSTGEISEKQLMLRAFCPAPRDDLSLRKSSNWALVYLFHGGRLRLMIFYYVPIFRVRRQCMTCC